MENRERVSNVRGLALDYAWSGRYSNWVSIEIDLLKTEYRDVVIEALQDEILRVGLDLICQKAINRVEKPA